jgi:hypothetical protein
MDFKAPIPDQAMTLLRKLAEVENWVKAGDPRAKPYLDADAIRIVDGKGVFHRERFIDVYADELTAERMAPADRVIATGKTVLRKEHN